MQIESKSGRLFRSGNQTKKNKDEEKESEGSIRLALDWLVLKSVKNIQRFLELENYYKRFVKEFTKIARLLHELTRKE